MNRVIAAVEVALVLTWIATLGLGCYAAIQLIVKGL